MKKLVTYIRGALGDIWPAITAIKPIIDKHNISKFDTTVITDNVYYFRANYPRGLEKFSIDMINKISPNVVKVSPFVNNNFRLPFDDTTNALSQENADKMVNEFMFWRPTELKEFVRKFIGPNTIFIDSLFTECIMEWNWKKQKYERIGDERATFEFNPPKIEKEYIDDLFMNDTHIIIHTRKKQEGDAVTMNDDYYNQIIKYCNKKNINVIVIGTDNLILEGDFIDLRGENPFSFDGIGYLIDNCNVMLGNDSGFSAMKLYQQQKDKLLIMNYPRWERSSWYFRTIKDKSNCLLLDARKNNIEKIKQTIGGYYGITNR